MIWCETDSFRKEREREGEGGKANVVGELEQKEGNGSPSKVVALGSVAE